MFTNFWLILSRDDLSLAAGWDCKIHKTAKEESCQKTNCFTHKINVHKTVCEFLCVMDFTRSCPDGYGYLMDWSGLSLLHATCSAAPLLACCHGEYMGIIILIYISDNCELLQDRENTKVFRKRSVPHPHRSYTTIATKSEVLKPEAFIIYGSADGFIGRQRKFWWSMDSMVDGSTLHCFATCENCFIIINA